MVGCVLVRDGNCIGEGYHRHFGGPHAEVEALRGLIDPESAQGATAYVSLEPCCHTGKTPPCTEALIAAKIGRVVIASPDPFPHVSGGGIRQLQQAGIDVEIGVEAEAARELNAPYLKRVISKRPWVIAKWAMSIDGRIATVDGDSQWITGELSRNEVHRLRARVDAIVVGSGTSSADNPTLTARPAGPKTPLRIVFADVHFPTIESNLVQTISSAPLLVVTSVPRGTAALAPLANAGAEILHCQSQAKPEMVTELLDELGRRGFTNVLVEGGGKMLASFASADEIDEIHAYVAPKLVGGQMAPGPVGGDGYAKLIQSPKFELISVSRYDNDIRMIVRKRKSL